jgi:hypothetical protein
VCQDKNTKLCVIKDFASKTEADYNPYFSCAIINSWCFPIDKISLLVI